MYTALHIQRYNAQSIHKPWRWLWKVAEICGISITFRKWCNWWQTFFCRSL